jgi:hypothetical protein
VTARTVLDRPVSAARERWPVLATWTLAALLVPACAYGLLVPDAYTGAAAHLALGSRAQDVLTLALLPLLLGAAHGARRGALRAHLLWLGLLSYLAYSYAIYLVGWPQNRAFPLYCAVVTIATAALVDGLVRIDAARVAPAFARLRGTRAVGWFLVVVGAVFTALWTVDLLPLLAGTGPPRTTGPGGVAFAVYVLDLVVALPAVVATGVALVRGHPVAPALGAVVLVKVVTLFAVLWAGAAALPLAGLAFVLTPDMLAGAVLLVVSAVILADASRRTGLPDPRWLHPALWP